MNHDTVRFCLHCQLPKKRDEFRTLYHTANRRMVCVDCYARIMVQREARPVEYHRSALVP